MTLDRSEAWRLWKDGHSLAAIGRTLGKNPGAIYRVISANGGVCPRGRQRGDRVLDLAEREEISRGIAAGRSVRGIAAGLGRAPSTVSREIERGGGRELYRATQADASAWERARRPKPCRLAVQERLRDLVAAKLTQNWSPAQIAGWLKQQFPGDGSLHVSTETIYRTLFIQARGALKRELIDHLRSQRSMRRSKKLSPKRQSRGQILNAVSIRERPAEVEDRAVPGHWEDDLLMGGKNSQIATLAERHSRYVQLVRLPTKEGSSVAAALADKMRKLPEELRGSLTWDRGSEMAQHKVFTVATDVQVYFCDPRSPWQRGTNENTNGLLRQYFPKGMDLSKITQEKLDAVALQLNTRPRKTLGFITPAEKLNMTLGQSVATTG